MVEPAEYQDVQSMTAVGKVLVTDVSTALLLGLLGLFCNKALEHRCMACKGSVENDRQVALNSKRA